MSVYTEYDTFRRQSGSRPEDFMRSCLSQARYPKEEIDSLVRAMADTVDKAMENLQAIVGDTTPVPRMKLVTGSALQNLSSTIQADVGLGTEEKMSLLKGFFGWLTGSSWRDEQRKVEELEAPPDKQSEPEASQSDWEVFDPSKATLPVCDNGDLDVDAAREVVTDYLLDASVNHDFLALGLSASRIEQALGEPPADWSDVPGIVVEALVSDILSAEECEFKKIAALDVFLRLTDEAAHAPANNAGPSSRSGLQLLAVKAAHDAFVQANDLKAGFKRMQSLAEAKLHDDAKSKEGDHV